MDLLTIVQTACNELGLVAPASVVGSADLQIKQLLALVNRDGIEVFKSKDWTSLQGEQVINLETPITVTGDVTTGSTTITNVSSTTGIVSGAFSVSGTGMPQAQRVTGTVTATTVDCEMEATATDTGVTLTFARDTYNIVSNFDRYIPHTWWDRTNHWMLVGPQSPQFDQWQRSGIVTTGPRRRWRQIGKKPTAFRLWPPPAATTVPAALVFEYVSNGWVEAVDGTTKNRFTADTDVPLFDEDMLILGVKWRFFAVKGFDYAAMQAEYVDFVNRERARDGGMPDLSLNRRRFPLLITSANVQDGFFPG